MKIAVGIDTSNYTTSVSAVTTNGELLFDKRKVLKVDKGKTGLRQSEALFQHIKNLPEMIQLLFNRINRKKVIAVAASVSPRAVKGSYMPVFNASRAFGQTIASALGVDFYPTTHQAGHISAGLWSAGGPKKDKFLAFHLSGGTTEFLLVSKKEKSFEIEIIGGSEDLNAGQFVDRVGVKLGLPFPAGPHIEKLAEGYLISKYDIKVSVKNLTVSFSGPETQAQKMIDKGIEPKEVTRAVLNCIAKSIKKIVINGIRETGLKDILFIGGVASNKLITTYLIKNIKDVMPEAEIFIAKPEYASDNAVGTALLAFENK